MVTIITFIILTRISSDGISDYGGMVIVTGIIDLLMLITLSITTYNMFELYLKCGGLG